MGQQSNDSQKKPKGQGQPEQSQAPPRVQTRPTQAIQESYIIPTNSKNSLRENG